MNIEKILEIRKSPEYQAEFTQLVIERIEEENKIGQKYKDRPRGMDPCREQTLEEKAAKEVFKQKWRELDVKYGIPASYTGKKLR